MAELFGGRPFDPPTAGTPNTGCVGGDVVGVPLGGWKGGLGKLGKQSPLPRADEVRTKPLLRLIQEKQQSTKDYRNSVGAGGATAGFGGFFASSFNR